jgi:hypothetical protein
MKIKISSAASKINEDKNFFGRIRAIDTWSVHGCVGFPIPVSG